MLEAFDAPSPMPSGGTVFYSPRYFIRSQLAYDYSTALYTLTATDGTKTVFDEAGRVISVTSPGGQIASYSYSGSELESITVVNGSDSNEYAFTWSSGLLTSQITSVNSHPLSKVEYAYDGTKLVTVKEYENSAASGSPVWGSAINSTLFTYNWDYRVRHVVSPAKWRQMVNNGIANPETATESQLNAYAEVEYEYLSSGQVSVMFTNGREYVYYFSYAFNYSAGTSFNDWAGRTDVSCPDGVIKSYFFNPYGQLMLSRVSASEVWYPIYQQFEEVSARLLLSASGSAIASVDESSPSLVTLQTSTGLVRTFTYDSDGNLTHERVKKGSGGTPILLESMDYISRTAGGYTLYKLSSQRQYRSDDGALYSTTSYAYTWHSSTLQVESITTTLPQVLINENGTEATYTRQEGYDIRGFLVQTIDEKGTVTTYQYDDVLGRRISMVQDASSGGLGLRTDYSLDDLGRTVRTLGPVHAIDISGTSTSVRSAQWTYYKDDVGEVITFRGYQVQGSTPVDQIVGPVTISRPNLAPPSGYSGWRQSASIEAVYSGSGIPSPTTTFAQSTWVRWTVELLDTAGKLKKRWSYFNIPSSGYGTQSVNYGERLFAYDSAGRQNESTCPGGTTDKTTYNAMSWPITEELGTSAGLSVTRQNEYDIDGNLTKVTLPVDSATANDRITNHSYDWRNRLIQTQTTVQKDGSGNWDLFTTTDYNTLNQPLTVSTYHTSVSAGNLTSRQTTAYDSLGRVYQTQVFAVSSTGTTSNPQVSNLYYGPTGQVARNAPAGSTLFTASVYDAIGRNTVTYQAYGSYTFPADPSNVSGAVVMSQQEMAWDGAGNLLSTISRDRFDDTTGNGPLGNPTSTTLPKARVSYAASYADGIGRNVATANYGTNGGSSWTRSATIPTRSDTVLVNSTTYDPAGNPTVQTDPASISITKTFDNLDRLITVVENSGGGSGTTRTTHYEYTDDGWLIKLKSDNGTTGQQVTEWVRDVVISSGGSTINSKRLVSKKIYPDSTGATDVVTYTYNRQLQVIGMTDQAGTAHAYSYDKLGRLLSDTVTFPSGTALDTTVGKLSTGYNERGLVVRSTSSNAAGTTVLNEVKREYNGFNQLVTEYQEHNGAVDPATSLKVQYSYANGSANTVRPTGITYPDSTVITTAYTGTQASAISRPDQIKEGTSVVASYAYLGLGTVVDLNYDAASNAHLTMQNGGTGDAGDKYTGLDRFGRLVETIWKTSSAEQVHTKYGRNRVGGVVWQNNVKAHASSVVTQDNYYWYDGLQQVTRHDRGDLTPSSGPPYTGIDPTTRQQQEDFTFDQTGNWTQFQTQSPSLVQSRTHDKANQVTSLTNPSSVIQPVFDATGNMTTMPKAGNWTTSNSLQWDAWNRLVKLTEGSSTITYAYDALTRRTTKTNSSETRHYYYDRQWRAVEERVAGASITVDRQYTWSLIDRWTLIRRKRTVTTSLDETRFVLKDYLDPAAIIDSSATVDERFGYDAFGKLNLMTPAFATRSTSVCDWNFLFHAEFLDSDSGLYNYGYRYYHPELGRWPSRDPIGEKGGMNLYVFIGNAPSNSYDILGLEQAYGLKGLPKDIDILATTQNEKLKARLFSRTSGPADGSSFDSRRRCIKKATLLIGIEVENRGLPESEQGALSVAVAYVELSLEASEAGVSIGDINREMDRNPAYQNNNGATGSVKVISYVVGRCVKFDIMGSAIRTIRDEKPLDNSYGYAPSTSKKITPAGHPGWADDSLNNNAVLLTARMQICSKCCNKADLLSDSKL